MKIPAILSPCNSAEELADLIKAGAKEVFFGILDEKWESKYTNIASPNRREWKSSNISSFNKARLLCQKAKKHGAKAFMTLNAFYTTNQEKMLREYIEAALDIDPHGFIVADPGLIIFLRQQKYEGELHVSTGGAVFNPETARLYQDIGATRIIIPRHNTIEDIQRISTQVDNIEFEAFIMNRGCKNIDAFCTFHHGLNEVKIGKLWSIPKKMKVDHFILELLPKLPQKIRKLLHRQPLALYDGACFIPYKVDILEKIALKKQKRILLKKNIEKSFGMETARDTCGACALWRFLREANLKSVKIVGRNNTTKKKISDIRFIDKSISNAIKIDSFADYSKKTRALYKEIYGHDCEKNCYYPI